MLFLADVVALFLTNWLHHGISGGFAAFIHPWRIHFLLNAVMFGLFGSQIGAAAFYSAFGDGQSPRRVLYSTFGVTIFSLGMMFVAMSVYDERWDKSAFVLLIPVFLFFMIQVPFWGVRSYFGWVLRTPGVSGGETRKRQFTLAHVLGWSVFLSVPLCILRAIIQDWSNAKDLLILGMFGLTYCVGLLLFAYVGFTKRQSFAKCLILTLAVGGGIELLQCVLVLASEGPLTWRTVVELMSANVSIACFTMAYVKYVRRLGFELSISAVDEGSAGTFADAATTAPVEGL